MDNIQNLVSKIEQRYNKNKDFNGYSKKSIISLLHIYFIHFLCTNNEYYIKKGIEECIDYIKKCGIDFDIICILIYFNLEINDKNNVDIWNDILSKYKKYLRLNNKNIYKTYIFLQGYIKSQKNPNRGVNKYIKKLQKDKENKDINILYIKMLQIKKGNLVDDIGYMENIKGNTFLKNIIIHYMLNDINKYIRIDTNILKKYIKWCLHKDINTEKILNIYSNDINFSSDEDVFNIKIYEKNKNKNILLNIVKCYINDKKYTENSYIFYKEAVDKNIEIPGLINAYASTCFLLNIEDIDQDIIKKYIDSEKRYTDALAYFYYLIITNNKYFNLLEKYEEKILKDGLCFLEDGENGYTYYCIYMHMFKFTQKDTKEEKMIIEKLYKNIFLYELTIKNTKNIRYIYVADGYINPYYQEVINNKIYISSINDNFKYYALDKDKKNIINQATSVKKLVKNLDISISLRAYEIGYFDDNLFMNIAKYYIDTNDKRLENIDIFIKILKLENITREFKYYLYIGIANIYFYNKKYENAMNNYKKILDDDYLSVKMLNNIHINNIIMCYTMLGNYERAISYLYTKYEHINTENIMYTIKEIYRQAIYNKQICYIAYDTIIQKNISSDDIKILSKLLIESYDFSLQKAIKFNQIIRNKSLRIKEIEDDIFNKTMYTHTINKDCENIFIYRYTENKDDEIIQKFLLYCMYESFYSEYLFSAKTIQIFENLYIKTKDRAIGYAYAHMCLKSNNYTNDKRHIFDDIIKDMEDDSINFNIFKNNKDKFNNLSYIYKNTPFIYNEKSNKDIYLYYKTENDEEYKCIKMKYFKFGIYVATLPIFYKEKIQYYYMEDKKTGSIAVKNMDITNSDSIIFEENDEYFKINNSLIYHDENSYEKAEKEIESIIKNRYNLKGKIL